ncbi:MAG: MBL fold metallo-hydrolase [Christensenellales bacterium]|jgi:phosphoribosyl 1,2-cyclic phosphodiesterase
MQLQVLSTGSTGNAYALHAGGSTLLLEAGIPIKQIVRGIKDWKRVVGCLVTHEHGDHAQSAEAVAKMGVKTYMTKGTKQAINSSGSLTQLNSLRMLSPVAVDQFTVMAFDAQHDAAEPCGYLIRYEPTGETVLYATDTFYLRHTFPGVHYWIAECNYIDEIIDEQTDDGELSVALRKRLKTSHMSLRRLLDALRANDLSKTRAIILVHLSDKRSDERAMVDAIRNETGVSQVVAADKDMMIPLELQPF